MRWSENLLDAPGGARDVEFWEQALAAGDIVADVQPFSGYLHQRVARILTFPQKSYEGLMTFAFMDDVIRNGALSRRLSDLKYALAIYKKQQLLYTPPSLRFYKQLKDFFSRRKKSSDLQNLQISSSSYRLKSFEDLRELEKKGNLKEIISFYEQMLEHPKFLNFEPPIMLKLIYFLYEKEPKEVPQWIKKIEKLNLDRLTNQALNDLKQVLQTSKRNKQKNRNLKSLESQVMSLMSEGLLNEALRLMQQPGGQSESVQMNEIRSWLGLPIEEQVKNKAAFFPDYFQAILNASARPADAAKKLADLAAGKTSTGYSSILRYQAWGLAYFDAKSYSQAFLYAQMLKIKDPLSDYSQLESMNGLFRSAASVYSGENLLKLWEKEPYRFEVIQRKNDWIGFKNSDRRVSETLVHEGEVYVLRYGPEGKVSRLQKALAGEMVLEEGQDAQPDVLVPAVKPGLLKKSVKTGWMDQFFYDYMNRYIPLGVRIFKNQLWARSQHLSDTVFTRFYSETEFQEHVVDKMRPALGRTAQNIQSQIDEQGFHLYSVLNLGALKVSVNGSGILTTEGREGQLILKMDHVKVGGMYLPEWLLRRTEKNFNYTANANISSQTAPIDILDMEYRPGGVLIKCRKRAE